MSVVNTKTGLYGAKISAADGTVNSSTHFLQQRGGIADGE